MILKPQEMIFFISNSHYFILVSLKPILFKPKFMFSFEANLEMKNHQFNFELLSIAIWKPFPVNDPKATMLY